MRFYPALSGSRAVKVHAATDGGVSVCTATPLDLGRPYLPILTALHAHRICSRCLYLVNPLAWEDMDTMRREGVTYEDVLQSRWGFDRAASAGGGRR